MIDTLTENVYAHQEMSFLFIVPMRKIISSIDSVRVVESFKFLTEKKSSETNQVCDVTHITFNMQRNFWISWSAKEAEEAEYYQFNRNKYIWNAQPFDFYAANEIWIIVVGWEKKWIFGRMFVAIYSMCVELLLCVRVCVMLEPSEK